MTAVGRLTALALQPVPDEPAIERELAGANAKELQRFVGEIQTAPLTDTARAAIQRLVADRSAAIARGYVPRGALAAHEAHALLDLKAKTKGLFADVVGAARDPDARVTEIVAKSKANAKAGGTPPLTVDALSKASAVLLGINQGPDRISRVLVSDYSILLERAEPGAVGQIEAFDEAGYHVLTASLGVDSPAVLCIYGLAATHGRNASELNLLQGAAKEPGRGNSAAIAAALEALVEVAVEEGFASIACIPGGPAVAALYHRMGFRYAETDDDAYEAHEPMFLDLTNEQSVRNVLFVFEASRAGITDVPKNVAGRLAAAGKWAPPPALAADSFALPPPGATLRWLED